MPIAGRATRKQIREMDDLNKILYAVYSKATDAEIADTRRKLIKGYIIRQAREDAQAVSAWENEGGYYAANRE